MAAGMEVNVSIESETIVKLAELARPTAERAIGFVGSLLGEPLRVSVSLLADQLYRFQWKNRIKIANEAREILAKDAIAHQVVPSGFFIQAIEAAGWAADGELQNMWARLIAAGVREPASAQHPLFIETLRRLSGRDARLLERIGREIADRRQNPLFEWHFPSSEPELLPSVISLLNAGIMHSAGFTQEGTSLMRFPVVRLTSFGVLLISVLDLEGPTAEATAERRALLNPSELAARLLQW